MKRSNAMERRRFTGYALAIATPIMVQNLISALVNAADTFMLGYVGQTAMSAAALAGQVQMILFMLLYGLSAGVSVLGAQYWGKRDGRTIGRVLSVGLRTALGIAVLFAASAEFFPRHIMRLLTGDGAIAAEGVRYLRVVGLSWLFAAPAQVYLSIQRSMEKVILPTLSSIAALIVNIAANAVFIFGWFGLPRLGIAGVALGTVLARCVEFTICAVHAATRGAGGFRAKQLFARFPLLTRDLMRISVPPVLNDFSYSFAGVVIAAILGHMGSDIVAANAVAMTGLNLGAVASRGVANATTVILGKTLGAGDRAKTRRYASRMTRLSALFGCACCAVMVLFRPLLLRFFAGRLSAPAHEMLGWFLLIISPRIWAEALNTCWNCGCLRSGGDSRYGFIVDTAVNWLFVIPMTVICAFALRLPPVWVFACLCLEEFIKLPVYYGRYRSDKWMNTITRDASETLQEKS